MRIIYEHAWFLQLHLKQWQAKFNMVTICAWSSCVSKACIPFIILAVYMLGSGLCKSRMRRHAGDPEMVSIMHIRSLCHNPTARAFSWVHEGYFLLQA
jgi:hypothetical protein